MTRTRTLALPLLAALALLAAVFAISACGDSSEGQTEVAEGEPVELGELSYNVIFSRFLNPDDNEDSAYLVGQPQAAPGSAYFGVFFEVQNEGKETETLPDSFTIVDADRQRFEAVPSDSLYALEMGGEVEPEEQVPVLDSTAQQGAIAGALVLFLLPASASENRPLILEIHGPGGPAEVTLDL